MRFQDASPDARAIVYAGIQADPLVARLADLLAEATPAHLLMGRAVMNGERTDPATWRTMFPSLSGDVLADSILAASLQVAERGEQVRSQFRGAIVEALTARLLARRASGGAQVRRERRVLFDGVRAEIHPYDVTLEAPGGAEVYDCKWGARGINADVLHQLDDARTHAAEEEQPLIVGLVVFDARRSCEVRLGGLTAPRDGTRLITLETLGTLGRARP